MELSLQKNSRTGPGFGLMPLRMSTVKQGEEAEEGSAAQKQLSLPEFTNELDKEERSRLITEEAARDEKHQDWVDPRYWSSDGYTKEKHNGGLGRPVAQTMSEFGKLLLGKGDFCHLGNYKEVATKIVDRLVLVNGCRRKQRRARLFCVCVFFLSWCCVPTLCVYRSQSLISL
jgi:hypothetical protein